MTALLRLTINPLLLLVRHQRITAVMGRMKAQIQMMIVNSKDKTIVINMNSKNLALNKIKINVKIKIRKVMRFQETK